MDQLDLSQPLFPRIGLCQQIEKQETDKSYYCHVPDQYLWMRNHYQIPYYQLETRFIADVYSYILGVDYDDSCSFIQQYLPSQSYLNLIATYLENYPLFEKLMMFYQRRGDRIVNSYLRSGFASVMSYIVQNKQLIKEDFIYYTTGPNSGFQLALEGYKYSPEQFIQDLNQLQVESLGLKYQPFFDQAAQDLQTYILKAPSTTGELITFRYVYSLDHFNLGQNEITRLEGFTSTSINHKYIGCSGVIFKIAFIIPVGSQVVPFIHKDALFGEEEILLPHGSRIVHEKTLRPGQYFSIIGRPFRKYTKEGIDCVKSQSLRPEIYIFRVLSDPWEVKAALAYNPLNYNLYGSCLNSVSEQTGVSIDTLKKISHEHLFSR